MNLKTIVLTREILKCNDVLFARTHFSESIMDFVSEDHRQLAVQMSEQYL